MAKRRIGVLVMSYGTPEEMEQVEAYYTHIRRGQPPTPEQLQNLKDRYAKIGGLFPLRKNTNAQVQALEETLNKNQTELQFICYQGLRHASPFIEDGIQQIADDGLTEAVGIVLAPHFSSMSIGAYIKRAEESARAAQIKISFVHNYHLHPAFIEAWVERVKQGLERFRTVEREQVRILFSAHSLPTRILEMNDPYPEQLLQTARAIIEQGKFSNKWQFTWQSAGQGGGSWLGPDILDDLRTLHTEENIEKILICPIGFVSDHLEILHDIDIECQQVAQELNIQVERTASLNTDSRYIQTLADAVLAQIERI